MADRPIIFSAPMVRAMLDGRKTQTRRVLKPQPEYIESSGRWKWSLPPKTRRNVTGGSVATGSREFWEYAPNGSFPYAVGDRLWVREAWRAEAGYDDTPPRALEYDSCMICFEANGAWSDHDAMTYAGRLRPSIHMPRWASRLTLTVTDVRVQRLADLTDEDAIAEGIDVTDELTPSVTYAILWDKMNAKRGFPWKSNPWIVALTFQTELNSATSDQ